MKRRVPAILLMLVLLLNLCACSSKAPAVYEVRFELNGGTLVSGKLLQTVAEGGAAEAPEVEREGYVFDGWSEELGSVTANTVAVAQWAAEPAVCEVRFELNGGTLVSGKLLQYVTEGEAAEAPEVEREGYVFDGWSEELGSVAADTVAVAQWAAEPAVYEVRFELNGGILISGRLLQQVTEGESAEAPVVEREGYAFAGWNEELGPITGNVIAAALWDPFHTVSFDAAGGHIVSGESEQHLAKGEMPVPPVVERELFSFAGWDPALEPVQGDTRYTAQWSSRRLSSEEIYSKISPAVVEINSYSPSGDHYIGSGFFIDSTGRLVTNYHVIDETDSGDVTLSDGRVCKILSVLDYDKALDLAVLQIDIADSPCLTISGRPVTTGETIYALGSSQGLTNTFSSGIVSTSSREIDGVNCIQITAPISQGNSGGPLVDPYGEVVGVNSMSLVAGQNLNFAIDIHELEKLSLDKSLTLAEVYAAEYPAQGNADPDDDKGFYADADYAEGESNDIFLLADQLAKGTWIAGEISSQDDMDWFYLQTTDPCKVTFTVIPYYSDDMDYLLCGILSLTDDGEDVELMDALMPTTVDGYDAFSTTISFDSAGTYFLMLCVEDAYPYNEPAYYAVRANW